MQRNNPLRERILATLREHKELPANVLAARVGVSVAHLHLMMTNLSLEEPIWQRDPEGKTRNTVYGLLTPEQCRSNLELPW